MDSSESEDDDRGCTTVDHGSEKDEVDELDISDTDDGPGKSKETLHKHKHEDDGDVATKQKRGPKVAKSERAAKPTPKKSTNPIDKFVDLSKAEETTKQKKLELHHEKANTTKELELEKIQVAGIGREKVCLGLFYMLIYILIKMTRFSLTFSWQASIGV